MSSDHDRGREGSALSRRDFLLGASSVAAGGVIGAEADARAPRRSREASAEVPVLEGKVALALDVNGAKLELEVEPRTTLLSALRCHAEPALTGTKLVCDRGNCGACTVLLDGEPVYSCLTLAVRAAGRELRTIEGLARAGEPSPVQRAMHARDALMCGFCTPGFALVLTACLEKNPAAGLEDIRRACAGNLCRCGTYTHVFEAGLDAARELRGGGR